MQPGATSCWGCCGGRQLLGLLWRAPAVGVAVAGASCWGCCGGRQLLGLLLRRDPVVLLISSRTEGAARPRWYVGVWQVEVLQRASPPAH
jgi:hypothetical protein